jgi:hypothetical protein
MDGLKVGKSSVIAIKQNQSAELMAKCVNESGITNKITSDIKRDLGITTLEENSTTSDNKMKGSATAESKATGPISELGDAVSGVLGSWATATMMPSIISFVACCCCIIIVVVAFFMLKGGGAKAIAADAVGEIDDYDYEQYGGALLKKLINNNYAL